MIPWNHKNVAFIVTRWSRFSALSLIGVKILVMYNVHVFMLGTSLL